MYTSYYDGGRFPSLLIGHVGVFHLQRLHPQWVGTCTSNALGAFVNGVDESFIRVRVMDLDITGNLGV